MFAIIHIFIHLKSITASNTYCNTLEPTRLLPCYMYLIYYSRNSCYSKLLYRKYCIVTLFLKYY